MSAAQISSYQLYADVYGGRGRGSGSGSNGAACSNLALYFAMATDSTLATRNWQLRTANLIANCAEQCCQRRLFENELTNSFFN